jgi:hypothetical protein
MKTIINAFCGSDRRIGSDATLTSKLDGRPVRPCRGRALPLIGALAFAAAFALFALPRPGQAQLAPEWTTSVDLGTAFAAGLQGLEVDSDGTSYMTGIGGPSPNTDIITASFNPDGTQRWSQSWDSNGGADQSRALARSGNILYVSGNTPGPDFFANILVLGYDAATGNLLKTIRYSSGAFNSEFADSVAIDAAGNIYVTGGTTGDGPDVITLKFDPTGKVLWKRTYDGPPVSPYSFDTPLKVLVEPNGGVVVALSSMMGDQHFDYVVIKYDPDDGATVWQTTWGLGGDEFARDMEIDPAGDVYVTGTAFNFSNQYGTIKISGSDGALVWQAYDSLGPTNHQARALFLDKDAGVFVTGTSDPDSNIGNNNDNFFTIKRDATSGDLLWTHFYGANCVSCFDGPSDVRADVAGNVFVAGSTSSPPFTADIILFVLDTGTGQEIDRGTIVEGGTTLLGSGPLRFDAGFNLYQGGNISDTNGGSLSMSLTKWKSLIIGSISCGDIVSFNARCKSVTGGSRLRAQVLFTDTSHSGEQVTITVDGEPISVTVNGRRAVLSIIRKTFGQHTFELTNPAGCFAPLSPDCD